MLNTIVASLIVVVAVTAGSSLAAQTVGGTLDVPAAAGGWVVQVITRGGIMGQGAGDIMIASDGRLSCGAKARCAAVVAAESLRSLQAQVRLAATEAWHVLPTATICSDCQTTTLVLTSRNGDGTLTTTTAAWDPTTRGKLSAQVVRVRDMAEQFAQPLTR